MVWDYVFFVRIDESEGIQLVFVVISCIIEKSTWPCGEGFCLFLDDTQNLWIAIDVYNLSQLVINIVNHLR